MELITLVKKNRLPNNLHLLAKLILLNGVQEFPCCFRSIVAVGVGVSGTGVAVADSVVDKILGSDITAAAKAPEMKIATNSPKKCLTALVKFLSSRFIFHKRIVIRFYPMSNFPLTFLLLSATINR